MRNIVLITLDSLRADHCGFMGYERATTPTIDKMAKEGLFFENAISPSTATPVSMIGIFTGEYSQVDITKSTPGKGASVKPWRKEIDQRKTLAQLLSKKGYSTAAINPNPFVSSYFGFDKGFDYFQDFLSGENKSYRYSDTFEKHLGGSHMASYLRILRNIIRKEEVFKPWENYYENITDWVKKSKKPFFLWLLSLDTHHPYLAPKKFRKESNLFDMYYYNLKFEMNKLKTEPYDEREKKKLINLYDDSIRYADSFVNKLWEDLRDNDPIFIVHADHGEGFCEHGYYSHQPYLYEESIHVPFVIFNADQKAQVKEPVSLLGISPTILELIGGVNEFPSKSLLNGRNDWVISKVLDEGTEKVAVRMKDWKLITGQKEDNELYNLEEDPQEQQNLIYEHPKLVDEMERIVKSHVKQELSMSGLNQKISGLKSGGAEL